MNTRYFGRIHTKITDILVEYSGSFPDGGTEWVIGKEILKSPGGQNGVRR